MLLTDPQLQFNFVVNFWPNMTWLILGKDNMVVWVKISLVCHLYLYEVILNIMLT